MVEEVDGRLLESRIKVNHSMQLSKRVLLLAAAAMTLLILACWASWRWWHSPERQVRRLVQQLINQPGFDSYFTTARSPNAIQAEFVELGSAAIPELTRLLCEGNWAERQVAARQLGKLRDPRSTVALEKALTDPEELVAQTAAISLGQIRETRSLNSLIEALGDPRVRVSSTAAATIRLFGSEAAVGLARSLELSGNVAIRLHVVRLLGELGGVESMRALRKAAQADPDVGVRGEAEQTIRGITTTRPAT